MSTSAPTEQEDDALHESPAHEARPLVQIASASVGITTFDGPDGYQEWAATTDFVLDTLRREVDE